MGYWIARFLTEDQQDAVGELIENANAGAYGN